jgi:hypothetical protein
MDLKKRFFMKSLFKTLGIIAIAAVIGFSMTACPLLFNYSLEGTWEASDYVTVTISGSTGVLTAVDDALYVDAVNRGFIRIGGTKFRNLTKTDDYTWEGEELTVTSNDNNPNVALATQWEDTTLTISVDGQSFQRNTPNAITPSRTFVKR